MQKKICKNFFLQLMSDLPILAVILLTVGCAVVPEEQEDQTYWLIGNIDNAKGTITTDVGTQDVVFRGQVALKAIPNDKGTMSLVLTRLNLLSKGARTNRGETGVIGLSLVKHEYPVVYGIRDGTLEANPRLTLHYPLIDRIKGFRSKGVEGDTNFVPFTEQMKATVKGKLPKGLQVAKEGAVSFKAKIKLDLDNGVLGLVPQMFVSLSLELLWERLGLLPSETLRIQPVFIGTGPTDLTATGVAFDTMIRRASQLWNRCGTVRCIRILVNAPRYVNNDAYRVLDNDDEAVALKDEVNVIDAVEIFVVERLADAAMAVRWGGGGTLSSGTASAAIVSSDQNLDVPCPEPCTTHEIISGRNADMCRRCGDTLGCGDVNYQHLSHELGHVLKLGHPPIPRPGLFPSTVGSVMEPSGLCCDNPDVQSARNCRNASNPLLYWGRSFCRGTPDILD